jgi:hypothetical protein
VAMVSDPEIHFDGGRDNASTSGPAPKGIASRRHQTWESRFQRGQGDTGSALDRASASTGWEIFSYLLAGMGAYGTIGWVVGHYTHIQLLFPIGMAIGLAISLGWVVYKFGRK